MIRRSNILIAAVAIVLVVGGVKELGRILDLRSSAQQVEQQLASASAAMSSSAASFDDAQAWLRTNGFVTAPPGKDHAGEFVVKQITGDGEESRIVSGLRILRSGSWFGAHSACLMVTFRFSLDGRFREVDVEEVPYALIEGLAA